jgi:hypothetical protein
MLGIAFGLAHGMFLFFGFAYSEGAFSGSLRNSIGCSFWALALSSIFVVPYLLVELLVDWKRRSSSR